MQTLALLRVLAVYETTSTHHGLVGTMPSWIYGLKRLEELSYFSPGMTGNIPGGMGSLRELRTLAFGSAESTYPVYLSGGLPWAVCNLKKLESLDLSGTRLSDEFPDCTLPSLRRLNMRYMPKLSLRIRLVLTSSPSLEHLNLHGSPKAYGDLFVVDLSSFKVIDVGHTGVQGSIPKSFWSLSNLTVANFEHTRIYGNISNSINQLTSIQHLSLAMCGITGTIPSSIGQCANLVTLDLSGIPFTGEIPPQLGNLSQLESFSISGARFRQTSIPPSLGNLNNLNTLIISDSRLTGEIPSTFEKLTKLKTLDLHRNSIINYIPRLPRSLDRLDLSDNQLSGDIPDTVFASTKQVFLNRNAFGPTFPYEAFANATSLQEFDGSNNQFDGILPEPPISEKPNLTSLALSFNTFRSTIPSSYRHIRHLDLSGNLLIGNLSSVLTVDTSLITLNVKSNQLSGAVGGSFTTAQLTKLILSDNSFTGKLPILPASIETLDCSRNSFSGSLGLWISTITHSNLLFLDLSLNSFSGPLSPELFFLKLRYLSLANNNLHGEIRFPTEMLNQDSSLIELDLSHNQFSGSFPVTTHGYPTLSSLQLAANDFSGRIPFDHMPLLSYLDLSDNQFEFDVSEILSLGSLVSVDLSKNQISGSLVLTGLTQLQSAKFDQCSLVDLDLESIAARVSDRKLEVLSIYSNSFMPVYTTPEVFGLARTTTVSPSTIPGVECHAVTFNNVQGFSFLFDEDMFLFSQCDCNATHFGFPPGDCFPCPAGSSSCGDSILDVAPNFYFFNVSGTSTPSAALSPVQTESCITEGLEYGQAAPGSSNCIGLLINGTAMRKDLYPPSIASLMKQQCRIGSEGRLCSRCICDDSGKGECFFQGTFTCERCKHTLKPSQSILSALGVILVAIVVLSIVMALVLKSRRSPRDKRWEELPVLKRVVYRVIFMTSLGNWTIAINFVQILVELTHWDSLALRSWVKLLNGDGEGLGLICIFPLLSRPLPGLMVRLLLPLVVVIVVAISIGIAESCLRIVEWKRPKIEAGNGIDEFESDSDTSHLVGVGNVREKSVYYPASALLSSISISVVKFLYFGSLLSAYSFVFSSIQPYTDAKYVMSHQWMLYSDAKELRMVSVPFIAIYTVLIPVGFVVLAWKVRSSFKSPSISVYIGSLFESFSMRLFWWEIVNVLRKVAVALILRGIPPSSAIQIGLVCLAIGVPMLLQTSLHPWKRRVENLMEPVGSFLLFLSLTISRSAGLSSFVKMRILMIVLDIGFVMVNVGFIVYFTVTGLTEYQRIWNAQYGLRDLPSTNSYENPHVERYDIFSLDHDKEETEDDEISDSDGSAPYSSS